MKTASFSNLYTTDLDISRLFAMNQRWNNGSVFSMTEPRKTSALLFLNNCKITYTLNSGEKFTAENKSVVYLPQGSTYTACFNSVDENAARTQLIEFLMTVDGNGLSVSDEPCVVGENDIFYYDAFDRAVEMSSLPVIPLIDFKATVYSLLSHIARLHRLESINTKELQSIAPAIKHLESNNFATAGVSELAKLCHISETRFRIIFKKYFSASPVKYIADLKMANAKRLLESGFYSVSEIAELLCYEDAGYFSKVFKKTVGVSPREYMLKNEFQKTENNNGESV